MNRVAAQLHHAVEVVLPPVKVAVFLPYCLDRGPQFLGPGIPDSRPGWTERSMVFLKDAGEGAPVNLMVTGIRLG